MQQRGFEVPPGLMEECKENPEACREKFQHQGFPGGPVGAPDPARFQNMSEEERQKFMEEDRRMMDFRGQPPGLPAQAGEFRRPEGMMPTEAFRRPPEGQGRGPEFQQQYQQQFEQQYQQEYKGEYERQYQAEFEQRSQQFMPPPGLPAQAGEFRPPEGMMPPEGYRPPQDGSFAPPPGSGDMMPSPDGGTFQPPPESAPPPPPPSDAPQASSASRFVASVLYIVASLFQL